MESRNVLQLPVKSAEQRRVDIYRAIKDAFYKMIQNDPESFIEELASYRQLYESIITASHLPPPEFCNSDNPVFGYPSARYGSVNIPIRDYDRLQRFDKIIKEFTTTNPPRG